MKFSPIHKKMMNGAFKTTDLSLCYQYSVRSLKDFYSTSCTSFLMKITYYHSASQATNPLTLAKIDSFITHEIYQTVDNHLEKRKVFLDISRAFDKVQHEGLILKLIRNFIYGNLLNVLRDFQKYRKQRALLNVQNSFGKESFQVFLKDLFWDFCCC